MRTHIAWTLTLAVGAWAVGPASGQAPPQKKATPPAAPRPTAPASKTAPTLDPAAVKAQQVALENARQEMETLLVEWEKQSKKVTSLDVGFERIDKSKAWGDQFYQGRAMLQSPDRACLEFQKMKVDAAGKPLVPRQLESEASERIVCTGKEVLQYEWDQKVVYVYPLQKEVRQKALQQGPLPFLFNMKAAEAKQRYTMTLLKQDEREYLIGIVPQEEIDRQSFSKAFLWLSKETFLPNKLWLYPVGEKELQEFKFLAIQANKPMDPAFFTPNLKMAGWKVIYDPGGEAAAKPAPAPAANTAPMPRRQAAQPATRPAGRPQ